MAVAGRELERGRARFVYVTRFGSHQCGGVLPLGGRRAQGSRNAGLKDGHSQEKPRAAAPGNPGAGALPLGFRPGALAASSPAPASREPEQAQASGACRRRGRRAGGACGSADLSIRFSSHLARGSSCLNCRLLSLFPAATPPLPPPHPRRRRHTPAASPWAAPRSSLCLAAVRPQAVGHSPWTALLSVWGWRDEAELRFRVAPSSRRSAMKVI